MEQLQLDLDLDPVPVPGHCKHEQSVVRTSDLDGSEKSLCTINGTEIWTNCRAWGRCTMRGDVFGGRQ